MPYRAPTDEFQFILDQIVKFPDVAATERFAAATPETVAAILAGAAKLADGVLAPLQRVGDTTGAALVDGAVQTPPGFAAPTRIAATVSGVAAANRAVAATSGNFTIWSRMNWNSSVGAR